MKKTSVNGGETSSRRRRQCRRRQRERDCADTVAKKQVIVDENDQDFWLSSSDDERFDEAERTQRKPVAKEPVTVVVNVATESAAAPSRKKSSRSSKRKKREKKGDDDVLSTANNDELLEQLQNSSDGDFMGDFLGDYEVFVDETIDDGKEYICLTHEDLLVEQRRQVEHVSELLAISKTAGAALLRRFQWKKEDLLGRYFENPDKVLKEAGIKRGELLDSHQEKRQQVSTAPPTATSQTHRRHRKTASSSSSSTTKSKSRAKSKSSESSAAATPPLSGHVALSVDERMCTICAEEELPADEVYALSCRHAFCRECWAQYLSVKVTEGESGDIMCPAHKCTQLVDEASVETLVDSETFERYTKFAVHSFVDMNDRVKWCPAPGCGIVVSIDSVKNQTVTCSCGHVFCFGCGEASHRPATCDQWKQWKKKMNDESETSNWIAANTQSCPRCQTPTEKNGGCNRMCQKTNKQSKEKAQKKSNWQD
jgi:ariadne-1